MLLCANENIPGDCVVLLRQRGHDVLWIRESAPGLSDNEVLARARAESRLLLTFDKEFGELAFRHGAKASQGIILFRISMPSPALTAEKVAAVLDSRKDWKNKFTVVDNRTVRMRPLPR